MIQPVTPIKQIIDYTKVELPLNKTQKVGRKFFDESLIQYPKRGPTNLWPDPNPNNNIGFFG